MKMIVLFCFMGLLTSCAMGTLAPSEIRKKEYIIETKVKKADAYSKALAHLAKNFGDSNDAIKVKNEGSGQIIAKGNTTCNILPGDGLSNYSLWFNLDFQAKDNKVRFDFEDLIIKYGSTSKMPGFTDTNSMSGQTAPPHFNIQKKEDVDKLESCLKPIVDGVTQAINGSTKDW